jgi:hypothetical protein
LFLQNVFCSVFELPSLKNTRKRDKTEKVEEKLTSKFWSILLENAFDMDFLQKYLYGLFELPLPRNAQKRTGEKKQETKLDGGWVGLGFSKCTGGGRRHMLRRRVCSQIAHHYALHSLRTSRPSGVAATHIEQPFVTNSKLSKDALEAAPPPSPHPHRRARPKNQKLQLPTRQSRAQRLRRGDASPWNPWFCEIRAPGNP